MSKWSWQSSILMFILFVSVFVFPLPQQYLHKRCNHCALVSSSGHMLGASLMEEIDQTECVIRMNNAPTVEFEKDVGSRTSVRVASHTSVPLLLKNERYYFQQSENTTYVFWGPERNMRRDGKGRVFNALLRIAERYPNAQMFSLTKERVQYCDKMFRRETGKDRCSALVTLSKSIGWHLKKTNSNLTLSLYLTWFYFPVQNGDWGIS